MAETYAATSADKKLIEAVEVFDVYDGEHVPDGKKSVAFSVRAQPTDHTMTEDEIEALSSAIIAKVQKATGGELR